MKERLSTVAFGSVLVNTQYLLTSTEEVKVSAM